MTTKTPAIGLATLSIDTGFVAKLLVCRQLDAARGLSEDSVFSAVWALKACYVARRPMFEVTDLTFAVAAEIGEMFFQTMFPSKGRRAITHVSASPFGKHKVIEVEFGR